MKEKTALKRKLKNGVLLALTYIAAGSVLLLAAFLMIYVMYKGLPHLNLRFIFSKPSYLENQVGILPDILNTLYLVILSLIVTLPLGIGAAIYLTEYARSKKISAVIEFACETLAGIPSIIYGLAGMLIFCQFFGLQTSLLAGALTLSVMNLPTIIRTTQESLKAVPQSIRDGAAALGAGKWRVIRTVVLPSAVDGIVTGSILAVGRVLGESAALLFTAGFAHSMNSFFSAFHKAGASLTVALYVYAKEQGDFNTAFAIAALLIILMLIINQVVLMISAAYKRRRSS